MKTFETAKRRLPDYQIEFELDGDKYHFTPPKTTGIWLATFDSQREQVKAQLDWLGAGLEPDEAERILERLKDPDDDFDLVQALEVTAWLTEEITARPTGPSPD
jgi:hypothetical protein